MNMSAACSALDALDRRMVQVTPLGIQGEGCRLGEKTHRVLDCRPGADSPRRQAALPASGRRYVTVLQGEGSLRRRPPFVHRMFGIEQGLNPLPVAGAGLDQAAVLNGHLIARQADRAVDVADGTGPASSRTPYPTAEQAGPQMLRAPVAAALSSPPPDPLPGLAAALRGLTHEAARFPQLIIIYDQIPDRRRGRGSQPEYTLTKPSNGPNDRDHLTRRPHRERPDGDRAPGPGRTRRRAVSYGRHGDQGTDGRTRAGSRCVSRGMELQTVTPMKLTTLYRSLS